MILFANPGMYREKGKKLNTFHFLKKVPEPCSLAKLLILSDQISESCKYFGSEPVEKGPEPCKYFFVTYRKSKKISSGHIIVSKNFLRTLLAGQVAYLVLGLQPSTCR